jgi:hypothetical protein
LLELFTEALREFGLLWLVFANLEVLIRTTDAPQFRINWLWHILHTIVAATFWWVGAYLDAKLLTENDHV